MAKNKEKKYRYIPPSPMYTVADLWDATHLDGTINREFAKINPHIFTQEQLASVGL